MAKTNCATLKMIVKSILAAIIFLILTGAFGVGVGAATELYPALNEPAIPVKNPSGVLLISVVRAGSRLVAAGEHGVIVYSDNNGQTWRQASVPVSVSITTLAFVTPSIGWAAGDYGLILHTIDGGATWTKQLMGNQVNQLMMAEAAEDLQHAPNDSAAQTALRRANIFMAAGPDKPLLTILPFDSRNLMVFGAYRMCVSSSNGGESWSDCSLDVQDSLSHNLYDAIDVNSTIYIAGEVGIVFRSDDGGKTFQLVGSPAQNTLLGILSTSDAALVTFGIAGQAYRSIDKGKTWTQVNISATANLTSGILLRSGVILLVCENGDLFLSHDDGLNFKKFSENQGMGLFDVTQAADGSVVFVGSGGVRVAPPGTFQ